MNNVKKYYYIDSNLNRRGPVEAYKLPYMGVTRNSYVWAKGMKDWAHAYDVRDLDTVFGVKSNARVNPDSSTIWSPHITSPSVIPSASSNIKTSKSFIDVITPLLYAIGCFILAALIVFFIIWAFQAFDDGKSHRVSVKVGVFIAPIMLVWKGLKYIGVFLERLFK